MIEGKAPSTNLIHTSGQFYNLLSRLALQNLPMTFEDLNLIEPILKALKPLGYKNPTPIQEQSIPIVLEGHDLLGCAQTGTGKTAAFTLPLLQLLHQRVHPGRKARDRRIKALIVTPTRELAIQIGESIWDYSKHVHLKHTVIFGGVGQRPQTDALRRGIDVLVATPGRLLDLMNQGYIKLQDLEFFVLDEADRMLDMGFIHDVKRIIAALPDERQSLFFSATMPPSIVKLSASILRPNPKQVEVTPESTTAETVEQAIYFVDRGDKRDLLRHLLRDPETAIDNALVFTRTKYGADKVARFLNKSGIQAEAIHGNKSQNARQRALKNFKAKRTRVLVATDIAARGIDVDHLSHVINYEIPNIPETYVHRIGRTGRAGASGRAYSFCDYEEKAFLRDITKLIDKAIPVISDHPYAFGDQSPIEVPTRRSGGGGRRNNNGNGRSNGNRKGGRNGNGHSNRSRNNDGNNRRNDRRDNSEGGESGEGSSRRKRRYYGKSRSQRN